MHIIPHPATHAACPHCHGTGKIYNPPVGHIRCGGCGGAGEVR